MNFRVRNCELSVSVLFIFAMAPESNNKKIKNTVKDATQKPEKVKNELSSILCFTWLYVKTQILPRPDLCGQIR